MIVGSLLLILVAVTLLGFGLANGSSALLISSIAASLLAAVALVVGARQAAAARADAGYADDERQRAGDEDDEERDRHRAVATQVRVTEPVGRRAGRMGGDAPIFTPPVRPAVSGAESTMTFESPVAVADPDDGGYSSPDVAIVDQPALEAADDEDPPDEPAAQYVSPADAARVARMTADVLVIDGRPRYHLSGCVHLLGRENEPLPVGEAVELGFTPCSRCEPDSALLADARRV